MIIEELVALIGFKVEGEEQIKRAATWFDRLKVKILEFAKAVQTKLRAAFAKIGDFVRREAGHFGRGIRLIGGDMAGLAAGASRLAMGVAAGAAAFAGLAVAGGVVIGVVAALATVIASVGGKIAQARRELQLMAAGMGTSARGIDVLGNAFSAIGGMSPEDGRKQAEDFIKGFSKAREDALRGDEKAQEKFRKHGLDPRDPSGRARDSTALGLDLIERRYDLMQKREKAFQKSRKAGEAADQRLRQFDEEFGISPQAAALLEQVGPEEFRRRTLEANARRPAPTSQQESMNARVAEEWSKLQNQLETVTDAAKRLAVALSDKLLPPLNDFLGWVISIGKKLGLVPETQDEVKQRQAAAKERVDVAQDEVDILTRPASPEETPQEARARSLRAKRAKAKLQAAQEAYDRVMAEGVPIPPPRPAEATPPAPPARPGDAPRPSTPLPQARPNEAPTGGASASQSRPQDAQTAPLTPPNSGGRGAEALPRSGGNPQARPAEDPGPTVGQAFAGWMQEFGAFLRDAAVAAATIQHQVSPSVNAEKVANGEAAKAVTNNVTNDQRDQRQVSVTVNAEVNEVPQLGPVVTDAVSSALVKSSNATTAAAPGP